MSDQIEHNDRMEAPTSGSRVNKNSLVIGALMAALILAFGYISTTMGKGSSADDFHALETPQLHTKTERFEMPVFKKPEPLKELKEEPVVEEATVEAPVISLPTSLPPIEPVKTVKVAKQETATAPAAPKIDEDLQRRLSGSVSGGSGFGVTASVPEPTIKTAPTSSAPLTTKLFSGHEKTDTSKASNKIGQASQGSSGDRSGIDLSASITQARVASQVEDLPYLLKKGTFINCVLGTNIQSDQAGFIKCNVTENSYGADGTLVLIERGSEILGEYKPESITIGKERLHAVWDTLTTPTGVRVSLGSPSVGRMGASGLSGRVDNHWKERLGVPVLLSLFRRSGDLIIQKHSDVDEPVSVTTDTLDDHYQEYANIRPTLHKKAGSRISIMLARDVSFKSVYGSR